MRYKVIFFTVLFVSCLALSAKSSDFFEERSYGKLQIELRSKSQTNIKAVSYLAERVELWWGNNRLLSATKDSLGVIKDHGLRIFTLPEIKLEPGYYILELKLFRPGTIHGQKKYAIYRFQTGIRAGKTSKVSKTVRFFLW